jgi:hypothetical protein
MSRTLIRSRWDEQSISDDQNLWWSNDLRNDWLINSCQSALIKLIRSKSVTITTRQSIDETDKESNIQAIETILRVLSSLKRCQCLFIDSGMKRNHVLSTWSRRTTHWTLNRILISRSFVFTSFRESYHFQLTTICHVVWLPIILKIAEAVY